MRARVRDQERIVRRLRRAYGGGYLDTRALAVRTSFAYRSDTRAELGLLTRDLPTVHEQLAEWWKALVNLFRWGRTGRAEVRPNDVLTIGNTRIRLTAPDP